MAVVPAEVGLYDGDRAQQRTDGRHSDGGALLGMLHKSS
jgi:hypothetical protein